MAKYTKDQFKDIGEILNSIKPKLPTCEELPTCEAIEITAYTARRAQWEVLVEQFVKLFQTHNSKFDRQRFLNFVGY